MWTIELVTLLNAQIWILNLIAYLSKDEINGNYSNN
jgi:hypothetical protein